MANTLLDASKGGDQQALSFDPDDAASQVETPAEEPDVTDPADEPVNAGDEEESAKDTDKQKGTDWEERYRNAERRMHEATQEAARTKGELAAFREQFQQMMEQQRQSQTASEEPLFNWINDDLQKQFDEDPNQAFMSAMKHNAADIEKMFTRFEKYMDQRVQSVDPREAQIREAMGTLRGQQWFEDLPAEAKRGAATAYLHQTQSSNGADSGPPPPASPPGGTRVPRQKKEVPMEKDPQWMPILQRMGGFQPPEAPTSLNEIPETQD